MVLEGLAERCEQTLGPDRELDQEIWDACFALRAAWALPVDWEPPEFTASLDAAIMLVPEGLKWGIGNPQDGYSYATMGGLDRAVRAASPALALCAAALRARRNVSQ